MIGHALAWPFYFCHHKRMKQKPQNYDRFMELLKAKNTGAFASEFSSLQPSEAVEYLKYDYCALNKQARVVFTDDVYNKSIAPLQNELFSQILTELVDSAKSGNYAEFSKLFSLLPDNARMVALGAGQEFSIFQIAYSFFTKEEIVAILNLLPEVSQKSDTEAFKRLIKFTRDAYDQDKDKARTVLGPLFLRAPELVCLRKDIAALTAFMQPQDFVPFLKKQNPDQLPIMYFTTSEGRQPVHTLYLVLKHQGKEGLSELFSLIPSHHQNSLSEELVKIDSSGKEHLYEKLMKFSQNGDSSNNNSIDLDLKIVELINTLLSDGVRGRIIMADYSNLSWKAIYALLLAMTPAARLQNLLTPLPDLNQNLLIEKIAQDGQQQLLDTLDLFNTAQGKFLIFSTPVKYGEKPVYVHNTVVNSTANMVGALAGWIPVVGHRAQQVVESMQTMEEVNEFLLARMLRTTPALISQLPTMLSTLNPADLTALLKEPDSSGNTILMYMMKECPPDAILDVLARADYAVAENKKMLDPKQLDFKQYRTAVGQREDGQGLVGLIGLLTIYHYMAVRVTEADDSVFDASKTEFLEMIKALQTYKSDDRIKLRLQTHCESHPLRQAYRVPLAITSVALGTNRHQDARNKLSELEIDELKKGITLFEEFISKRTQLDTNGKIKALDQSLFDKLSAQIVNKSPTLSVI